MPTAEDHFNSIYTAPFRPQFGGPSPNAEEGGNFASMLGEEAVDLSHGDDPQLAARAAIMAQKAKEAGRPVSASPEAHFAAVTTSTFRLPQPGEGTRLVKLVPLYAQEQDYQATETAAQMNSSGDSGLAGTINYLLAQVACLTAAINGASIAVVCNGDGTVTVTLTWGASC